jgi:Protein of unknown function (DUF3631)
MMSLWRSPSGRRTHTHLFRVGENGERDSASEVTPYMAASSAVPGCGKSLLLEVLEPLVARAWKTGGMTGAALARKVHSEVPTLLLDEADQAFSREREYVAALSGLLNDGYRRRGTYTLCVPKKDGWEFVEHRVYCPKMFAGLRGLPDTVASRSIPIRLKMKTADEAVEEKHEEELYERAEPIYQGLVSWAARHFEALRGARPDAPAEIRNPRTKEIWRPLLGIADLAAGPWPESARRAAVTLSTTQQQVNDDTLNIELLADIRRAFDDAETDRISSRDLIRAVAARDDGPWTEWWDSREDTLGKAAGRKLANRLKVFGIHSRDLRIDGSAIPVKGFERSDFEDHWLRLLPPPQKSATLATAATTQASSQADVADVADVADFSTMGGWSA